MRPTLSSVDEKQTSGRRELTGFHDTSIEDFENRLCERTQSKGSPPLSASDIGIDGHADEATSVALFHGQMAQETWSCSRTPNNLLIYPLATHDSVHEDKAMLWVDLVAYRLPLIAA